jgi:enoyl-CoA hydratase/carnithine racemase
MDHGLAIADSPDGIRTLTITNVRRRNALDEELLGQLDRALDTPEGIRVLLLRGHGDQAFCAGYDLTSLAEPSGEGALPDDRLMQVLEKLERHPLPSVALVTGAAFGAGCDLASACDLRIGSEAAFFCLPPAKLGVVYAEDGLTRLVRLLGPARAKWMFLTGRRVDSNRALYWGLLDEVYPTAADAEQGGLSLCREVASNAPLAVQGMKRGIRWIASDSFGPAERTEHRKARLGAYRSEDAREGKAAFLEKRLPTFRGR